MSYLAIKEPTEDDRKERPVKLLAAICASLLLFTACGAGNDDEAIGTDEGIEEETGDPGTDTGFTVTAQDFSFSPNHIDVEPGTDVSLEVTNSGSAPHTFTSEDLDADERLAPGSTVTVNFTAPEEMVEWRCTIHPQMTGTIGPAGSDAGSGDDGAESDADDLDY